MNKDSDKTKEQLLSELAKLRKKNKEQQEKLILQNKEFEDKFLQRTKEFKKSEHNYKMLFNESPVPTWEEDFSQCKTYIDSLKKRNINNFREYFEKNPDEVIDLSKKVKIIDINKAVLQLHEAQSKQEILQCLSSIFTDKSYETFTEQLIFIAEGEKEYESEAVVKTIAGLEKHILLKWAVVPGYENTLEKVYVTTIDITERKLAEKKLKESENRLKHAEEIAHLGHWELNLKNNILTWSDEVFRMFDLNPQEFEATYEAFLDNIHPDDREKVNEAYTNSLKTKTNYEIEHRLLLKTGKLKYVLEKCRTDYDDTGKPIRSIGTVLDITDRKQAEEALKNSLLQIEMINANTPNIIWKSDIDKQGNFINTYLSEVVDEFLELPKGTVNNSWDKYFSYIIPDYLPQINELFKKGIANPGQLFSFSYEVKKADGEKAWFTSSVRVRIENNKLTVYGSTVDITERKKAQEIILELKEFNESIVKNLAEGIIFETEDGIIQFANPAMLKMLGYKEDELVGKHWSCLVPKHQIELVNSANRRRIKGESDQYEMELLKKNGEKIFVLVGGVPNINKGVYTGLLAAFTDITDRKKAEVAQKEAQSNLEALLDNRRDSIWALDNNYNYLVYNKPYADVIYSNMGIRLKKGMNAFDIHPKEVNDFWKPKFDEVLKGEYVTFEFSHVLDGEENFFEVYLNPIYTDNKVSGLSVLSMDITKRKRAQKELIKLSTAVTQSPSIILITDVEGNIEYVNPKFTKITGYSQEEVTGKNPRIFKSGKQTKEMYKKLWKTISSGKTWRGEFHDKKKNGQLFWEMASISPIFDEQGKIINYIKVSEDITEKKKTEQELIIAKEKAEESEYKIRSMFENTQIGILYCNAQGKILEANQVMLDILGSPSLEATLKINLLTFKPLQDNGFAQNVEKCISEKIIVTDDTVYTTKWGKTVFMKYYLVPVILNNKVIGVWANLNNLTDLWNIQNQLKKAKEKAEESNRLKTAFLNNMSHEIRTPMNGILGFTSLLKKPNLTGEKQEEYISVINESGMRMINIIDDIINISKIEANFADISILETNINEQLEYINAFFKPDAERKGIKLSFQNTLRTTDVNIKTDKEKLVQILFNLVKNAIKFTDKGSIEFGYNLKKDGSTNVIEFFVKDTGIGIPHKYKEVIFERFRQVSESYSRKYEGTGLGLSISKALVEKLGGKIWVESNEGVGSVFYFTLPYNVVQKRNIDSNNYFVDEQHKPGIHNLKILVADDDNTSSLLLNEMLRAHTNQILNAKNGNEAIDICKNNKDIDLVLMDLKMPKLNGYKATKKIRQFNKDIVIIAQTAFSMKDDKELALKAGCNDYVAKPINEETLIEIIEKYLKI